MSLRISTPQEEGEMQISKSLKLPILLDSSEMSALFNELGDFQIFLVGRPLKMEDAEISKEDFLETYQRYVELLKIGRPFDTAMFRPVFSSVITQNSDALYAMSLSNDRFLIKSIKPVIQMQAHHFIHSKQDGKFHLGVMGGESISWGIQFSYPQLYQNPKTKEIGKVEKSELFQILSRWVRSHTMATPFLVNNERVNVPTRLGKSCFDWIKQHPDLKKNQIEVMNVNSKANS